MKRLGIIILGIILLISIGSTQAQNTTAEQALDTIVEAQDTLQEMREEGYNTTYIQDNIIAAKRAFQGENHTALIEQFNKSTLENKEQYLDILNEAQEAYEQGKRYPDYEEITHLTQEVSERHDKAIQLTDKLRVLELKINEYQELGVDTTEAQKLHTQAQESFHTERYEETENRIEQANTNLEDKRAELTTLHAIKKASRTFLEKHWKHLIIAIIIISITSFTGWKVTERIRAKKKVETLRIEEQTLKEMMKEAQTQAFKKKTLPMTTYEIRMDKYREKLADIRAKIPVYEAIAKGEKPKEKTKEEKTQKKKTTKTQKKKRTKK